MTARNKEIMDAPPWHCNTLQHAAKHCITLQHTTTHCRRQRDHGHVTVALQHTATRCDTLHVAKAQHNAPAGKKEMMDTSPWHCDTLQHTAAHCNTLQHTATTRETTDMSPWHCNTLQQTAAHCNQQRDHLHVTVALQHGEAH